MRSGLPQPSKLDASTYGAPGAGGVAAGPAERRGRGQPGQRPHRQEGQIGRAVHPAPMVTQPEQADPRERHVSSS